MKNIRLGDTKSWFNNRGDLTHRLDYNLNTNSIVVDIGAYEGQWAINIYKKYNCNIIAYEPVSRFYCESLLNNVKQKVYDLDVKSDSKFICLNLGIGHKNESIGIKHDKNASSIFGNLTIPDEIVRIVDINDEMENITKLFKSSNPKIQIDLMKINTEGCEYDLLIRMIEVNKHKLVDNIQVQFHQVDGFPWKDKYDFIYNELSKTHRLTYRYPFVWENWKLIES